MGGSRGQVILQRQFSAPRFQEREALLPVAFVGLVISDRMVPDDFEGSSPVERAQGEDSGDKPPCLGEREARSFF
jgi:hypothetical protein